MYANVFSVKGYVSGIDPSGVYFKNLGVYLRLRRNLAEHTSLAITTEPVACAQCGGGVRVLFLDSVYDITRAM